MQTGLVLEVPTDRTREYLVWIVCHAHTFADAGFAVATRAGSSVVCTVPFVVVEDLSL